MVPINETHAEGGFASLHCVCIASQAFAIVNDEVVQEPCFERCTNYPFLCYLLQVFAIVNNEVVQEPGFERCTNYPFLCYLLQVDLPAAYNVCTYHTDKNRH